VPNWCNNGLTLSHADPSRVKAAVEAYREGRLLDHFVPVPEALKNPDTASWGGDNADEKDLLRAQLREQYGYESWYDFCVNNWGTKWDVGGDDGTEHWEEGDTTASFSFDSAWAPPIAAYEQMVAQGFSVEGYYYEPGMAFVGVWRDGWDECVELGGLTSKTVRAAIGEELDDYWCISESMAEWEDENPEDELTEWYEEGVEKLGLDPHK